MFSKFFKKPNTQVYYLLNRPVGIDYLGVWERHLGHYTKVIGYSATGTIFLYSREKKEYLAFYPSMSGNNSKNYGQFENLRAFEEQILKERGFADFALYPIKYKDLTYLEKKLGHLESQQIYYPKLDTALGGSLNLDGFGKGDIWVRTDILGQNRGLE